MSLNYGLQASYANSSGIHSRARLETIFKWHQEIHTFLNFLNQLISLNLKLVCSLSHHSPGISNIFFV
jgi:hypothetical protein